MVICNRAKDGSCSHACWHQYPHRVEDLEDGLCSSEQVCETVNEIVQCVPVEN